MEAPQDGTLREELAFVLLAGVQRFPDTWVQLFYPSAALEHQGQPRPAARRQRAGRAAIGQNLLRTGRTACVPTGLRSAPPPPSSTSRCGSRGGGVSQPGPLRLHLFVPKHRPEASLSSAAGTACAAALRTCSRRPPVGVHRASCANNKEWAHLGPTPLLCGCFSSACCLRFTAWQAVSDVLVRVCTVEKKRPAKATRQLVEQKTSQNAARMLLQGRLMRTSKVFKHTCTWTQTWLTCLIWSKILGSPRLFVFPPSL